MDARDEEGETRSAARRPDLRRWVYAGLDLAMALVCAALISGAPSRHLGGAVLLWSMVGALAVAGVATCVRHPRARLVAAGACALLLLVELLFLVALVASAAFLAGVYGSFGKGAALIALVVGALSFELVALLPALQLRFLLGRAGKRAFSREAA